MGTESFLAPLLAHPGRAALLFDVDGTLAPIAASAGAAVVPAQTRELLEALTPRYRLVACVSGRRAVDARALVGVESIHYVGNHGFERLRPGAPEAEPAPGLERNAAVEAFARASLTEALRERGVRLEDKRAIWSFHWRGAPDEADAHAALAEVADDAAGLGLVPHWGRKVLEIRPPTEIDKGVAVAALVREAAAEVALYAGDDTTDLHAFRELRALAASGDLRRALCIGVRSDEAPDELERSADLLVDGTEGVVEILKLLANPPAADALH